MRPAVLVVEDDLATRTLLDVVLTRSGFEVDLVSTGTDVMTLLSSVRYSALVFDLYMRGTLGHDLLSVLAAKIPEVLPSVVVVSSAPKQELERVRQLYPTVRALRKPFELDELLGTVTTATTSIEQPSRDAAAEFCRRSILGGAKAGVVCTPAANGKHLNVAISFGYSSATLEGFDPISIDSPYPACLAYRHSRAIWLASLSAASSEYPLLLPVLQKNESRALAALPLVIDGRTIGVVGWSFRESRSFSDTERNSFEDIAAFLAKEFSEPSSTAKAG